MKRKDMSYLANIIPVRIFTENGSHIEYYDLSYLIDLFDDVTSKKDYQCDIKGLKSLLKLIKKDNTNDVDFNMLLATQLSYQYTNFFKYLIGIGETDFDWIYSKKLPFTIYGVNNVVSSIGDGIAEYCERVGGIELKQYFVDFLSVLKGKSKKM